LKHPPRRTRDVMPKTYNRLDNSVLIFLLKNFNAIPMDIEDDALVTIPAVNLHLRAGKNGRDRARL
jgi:hypothetical protein